MEEVNLDADGLSPLPAATQQRPTSSTFASDDIFGPPSPPGHTASASLFAASPAAPGLASAPQAVPQTIDILDEDDDARPHFGSPPVHVQHSAASPAGSTASDYSSSVTSSGLIGPADAASAASSAAGVTADAAASASMAASAPATGSLTRQYAFEITVDDPEQVGEGMGAYVTYKVYTKSEHPSLRSKILVVVRRYREFDWLHDTLQSTHRDAVVPPLPEKNATASSTQRLSETFKQYRRRELERFLRRVAAHPTLSNDPNFHVFLEGNDEQMDAARKRTGGEGLISWLGSTVGAAVGSSSKPLTSITADEPDEYFKSKADYITEYEALAVSMCRVSSALNRKLKESADLHADFIRACKATNMGSTVWETRDDATGKRDKTLAESFTQLAAIQTQTADLLKTLSEQQTVKFEETLRDYTRVVQAVKDVLFYRHEVLMQWRAAEKAVTAKKEKLKGASLTGAKAAQLQKEIEDGEKEESNKHSLFDQVSLNARNELRRFEDQKAAEMRATMRELIQLNIAHESRSVDLWKRFLLRINEAQERRRTEGSTSSSAAPADTTAASAPGAAVSAQSL